MQQQFAAGMCFTIKFISLLSTTVRTCTFPFKEAVSDHFLSNFRMHDVYFDMFHGVLCFLPDSFLEFPIPNGVAFIGEVGLGGELRMVSICFLAIGIINSSNTV